MKGFSNFPSLVLLSLLAFGGLVVALGVLAADDLVPLEIKLPMPAPDPTPGDFPLNEHIEKPSDKPRPPFLAPKGARNVALHKNVTLSDSSPINGAAEWVTDGNKELGDAHVLEIHRKLQWVQIDLERPQVIYAILVWHAYDLPQITKDVVVQVADDAGFTRNVRTIFNNDYDNSAGLGVGQDKEYFERYEGRLLEAKGQTARYVRLYSQGSTYTALNRYTEVEVYGLPQQPAR
jgi:hypothetical protein